MLGTELLITRLDTKNENHCEEVKRSQAHNRLAKFTATNWVDGICGSGQNGTVKNGGVENAGVDISARCGRGGQCRSGQIGTVWRGWTLREK